MHTRGCTRDSSLRSEWQSGRTLRMTKRKNVLNDKKRQEIHPQKIKKLRGTLWTLWWKKPNAARSVPTSFYMNYQLSIINYQLKKLSIKSKDYGTKQVTLGKNSQHRNHRVNRHRHHLRGDLMHRHIERGRPALPIPSIQSVNYSVIFFVVSSFFH